MRLPSLLLHLTVLLVLVLVQESNELQECTTGNHTEPRRVHCLSWLWL